MVVLGGAHHKVEDPHPQAVVVKLAFFVGGFFCLESSDTEK